MSSLSGFLLDYCCLGKKHFIWIPSSKRPIFAMNDMIWKWDNNNNGCMWHKKKLRIQRFWARFYFFWCKVKEDAAFYAISNGWSSCSNNLILCSGLDGLCHFSFFSFLLFNRWCELDEVCRTYFMFTGPTSFTPVRNGSMIADDCRKGSSSHPRSKYTAAACQKFKWQQGFQRWDDSEWRRNI